ISVDGQRLIFRQSDRPPNVASFECMVEEPVRRGIRRLFWAAVWLAVVLIATKGYYLGLPSPIAVGALVIYGRSLAAISYGDVMFVVGIWAGVRAVIALIGSRPLAVRAVSTAFVGVSAFCCLYAVANVLIFGVFGG